MKVLIAIPLLFVSVATSAGDSLAARVDHAKAVENSPVGQLYQKELWKALGQDTANLMLECFPKGTQSDASSFTLVANVLASGALGEVRVEPSTPMTTCFSTGFSALEFPRPPASFRKTGLPLVIQMEITE